MKDTILTPRKALNKAFLKVRPNRDLIEKFKTNLIQLLDRANASPTESEEFHKNLVSDFLKHTYYSPSHFINTKGRNDLVIHNGKDAQTSVGVIVETKKPGNKSEMPKTDNLNAKAVQELVLYYLRERIANNNLEIRYLVATNMYEWFIWDAVVFDKVFAQNKTFAQQFADFEAERLAGKNTDFFYKEIAAPAIAANASALPFTYFNLHDYEQVLRNADPKDDNRLVVLFKLLSPEHLLKLPFTNDSNTLDKGFYSELLHIIGLAETKEGGKKVIGRKKPEERNPGSLLENAIAQLNSLDKLHRVENPGQYGATKDERLFNVGLELVITWINRILFLKLLEAQLISYHKGDTSFAFLNKSTIADYDDLHSLFFDVLAQKPNNRDAAVQEVFSCVPYLNSSLFEPTDLEHTTVFISNLRDERTLPILSSTVLKDTTGKKRTGELNALDYLFSFLDAYDFSGEGSEEIQEDNKTLINASVLGLIFEKINGYKDGSYFTPGFITMYMCRETIRRAVVQKFNEVKGWDCKNFDELYDKIDDRKEANAIVNSLKICDPAVGSGHFLVSALNELIAVKNDLKILTDRQGKRLKEYHVEVVNDELVIVDEDALFFEYKPGNRESQRIQETLFHEKQTIIENCLFGVDINPNSVKICRLRLWIELLKSAYYKADNELETLPNIDINIKCGNSLISRFALDVDLRQALKGNKKGWTIEKYRQAVDTYRNAESKEQKRDMEMLIADIKGNFRSEISKNDPKVTKLNKKRGELYALLNQEGLFDISKAEQKKRKQQQAALEKEIEQLEAEIEEIKSNKIYDNAFEWRIEFPEVLNDDGDFVGFDVVIGNPPYIRQEEISPIKPYLQANYRTYVGTADLYVYFVEKGVELLRANGQFAYILPNKWMQAGYGKSLRLFFLETRLQSIVDFGDLPVFQEAITYPCVLQLSKAEPTPQFSAARITALDFPSLDKYVQESAYSVTQSRLNGEGWSLSRERAQNLLNKLRSTGMPLGAYANGKIFRGVLTGLNEAFVIDATIREQLIDEDARSAEVFKPFLAGRDIKRYDHPEINKFLILFPNGWTNKQTRDIADKWKWLQEQYPAITSYLAAFQDKAEKRWDKGEYWWELRACDYYEEFKRPKIVVGSIAKKGSYLLDKHASYSNDKTSIIVTDELYLLGLLNSKLLNYYMHSIASTKQGGYYEYKPMYLQQLPIRVIDHTDNSDREQHDRLTHLVEKMIGLYSRLSASQTDEERSDLEQQIASTDNEIDQLVYKLYDLTEEEIAIVERG